MLGREPYRTRVLSGVHLPELVGQALDGTPVRPSGSYLLLGGFDLSALREIEIWRRLIERTPVWTAFFRPVWGEAEKLELAACIPPSRHGFTLAVEDPAEAWSQLISPDRPDRCFVAVVSRGQAAVLMIGPPTEEAWDLFSAHAAELPIE